MEIIHSIKKIFEPGETLAHKVTRGTLWVFLLRGITQVTRFIRTIILARLLAPTDFGLMGIAGIVIATLDIVSNPSFEAALIQKKEGIEEYLDTAWIVPLLRGIVLWFLLYWSAPFIARFFENSEAASIVRVVSFGILLTGLNNNVGIVYFMRELDFRKRFIFDLSGVLADALVSISLAFILRSVWALVFGLLAGGLVRTVVSYIIHPYRPRLKFDFRKAREIFNFGKWIMGSNIIVFLINNGDNAFVGKFLGTAALGLYQFAFGLSNIPATEITNAISSVTFPAYSRLQDNIIKLRKGYLRTLRVTSFISIPLAGGIFVVAPQFIHIFLGDKWKGAITCLQVLCLWGMSRSISATTGPIFQAVGKPEILTKLVFVRLIIMAVLIYPFSLHWGITGTALAVVLSGALIIDPVAYYLTIKIIKCRVRDFCRIVLLPLINTAVMVLIIFVLKTYVIVQVGILDFFILLIVGVVSYLGLAYLTERDLRDGLKYKASEKLELP